MKCTNRRGIAKLLCLCIFITGFLTGCGSLSYDMAYEADSSVSSFNVLSRQNTRAAEPFASDLCVASGDVSAGDAGEYIAQARSVILFGLNDKRVICAQNIHERLNPASLTKVMTALVALKNGSLDQMLTATDAVKITESGAQLAGVKPGDTMTLDQALRILLIHSANDVAMMIAEGVGGSVENFVEMMNAEARALGATNTHFTNPHGLTDAEHYTTAYDLYLIFNEAIKYETFSEIIQMTSYQTTYYDKDGHEKNFDKSTTNGFLSGSFDAPANVTVIGGKTGTTAAAGHCLMLLSRDVSGAPYISIVMGAPSGDVLYSAMKELLGEIVK